MSYTPSYTIDPYLQARLTQHAEALSERYSRLIPFRMDFSFLNGTALSRIRRDDYSAREMYLLAEYALQQLDGIVGYAWVQEFTPRHGIHYHAVFYLNGLHHRVPQKFIYALVDYWRHYTGGDGWFHDCTKDRKRYPVDGQRVLHYADPEQRKALARMLGYLAKTEQKDYSCYCFGLSDVPEPSRRGRPRKQASIC